MCSNAGKAIHTSLFGAWCFVLWSKNPRVQEGKIYISPRAKSMKIAKKKPMVLQPEGPWTQSPWMQRYLHPRLVLLSNKFKEKLHTSLLFHIQTVLIFTSSKSTKMSLQVLLSKHLIKQTNWLKRLKLRCQEKLTSCVVIRSSEVTWDGISHTDW